MQASAFLTILSLSAALNTRLVRFGVVSTAAPLAPSACSRRSASGRISRTGTGDVLGTVVGPFSAHRHLRFQQGLSHATLAQGAPTIRLVVRGPGAFEERDERLVRLTEETSPENRITVPDRLHSPCELVQAARAALQAAKG